MRAPRHCARGLLRVGADNNRGFQVQRLEQSRAGKSSELKEAVEEFPGPGSDNKPDPDVLELTQHYHRNF